MKNSNQNTEKQTVFNRYETFIPDSDDISIGYDCLKAIYKMKGIESNPIEDLYSIYFEDYFEGDDNQKAELIAEVENDPSLHIWKKGNIITSHVYIDGFGEGELNLNDLTAV